MKKEFYLLRHAVVRGESASLYATFILRQHALDWAGHLRGEDGGDYYVLEYNRRTKMYETPTTE